MRINSVRLLATLLTRGFRPRKLFEKGCKTENNVFGYVILLPYSD